MRRVSTYHGTPYDVPSKTVVSHEPGKNLDSSMRSVGVASSAPDPANSETHVVPARLTSGVSLAAIALAILSCAASNGMTVTLTLAFGFSASKPLAISPSFSPSAPSAQMVIEPVALPDLRPGTFPCRRGVSEPRPQPVSTMPTAAPTHRVASRMCDATSR